MAYRYAEAWRQQEVGAQLRKEEKKRATPVQGIRRHQHVAELDAAEELLESSRLAARVRGLGGLGNRHPQRLAIQARLGDERR